jgi:hypothetical protein
MYQGYGQKWNETQSIRFCEGFNTKFHEHLLAAFRNETCMDGRMNSWPPHYAFILCTSCKQNMEFAARIRTWLARIESAHKCSCPGRCIGLHETRKPVCIGQVSTKARDVYKSSIDWQAAVSHNVCLRHWFSISHAWGCSGGPSDRRWTRPLPSTSIPIH